MKIVPGVAKFALFIPEPPTTGGNALDGLPPRYIGSPSRRTVSHMCDEGLRIEDFVALDFDFQSKTAIRNAALSLSVRTLTNSDSRVDSVGSQQWNHNQCAMTCQIEVGDRNA